MFDMLFEHSRGVRFYPQITSKIIVQLFTSKFSTREEMFEFFCESDLDDFGQFIKECVEYEYPWKYIQDTVNRFFAEKMPWCELTLKFPFVINSNVSELDTLCDTILKDNPKSVEDYRKGKTNSINHLKGVAMKMTKGKADIKIVTEILERKLKE
jgi:Asp-tRNA(Asn)/Glu-tRNA(Gln) amidotransferase B subunit